MPAGKRIISQAMIKGRSVERDDVERGPFVFRMTIFALRAGNIRHPPVQASLFSKVRTDILMALKAQAVLG